jgi:L-lactate dehydrogenase (cytochrome)
MLGTKRRFFGNIVGHAKGVSDPGSLADWTNQAFDPSLDWKRIAQFKRWWGGKLIVKGIMEPEDARRAADMGADAIVVSNHGGRQLDGTPSVDPHAALDHGRGGRPDGGASRQRHPLGSGRAEGAGAGRAGTYVGRAFTYGLGAMGEAGVTRALEVIHKELDMSMALCGERDVRCRLPADL